ncbi:putative multiple sugar transport system substrate-binding protein YtcQ [Paenibacillus algicola]|uniref:Putative multiple sugar transport system substrate-binding protein YtcQ n=1 Tax=Paenibacillus algicola TaxID=2565926 RepID=A0A4P8XMK3_9BACL|nr:extracellular solute-binding protein [Paenibacillus algicola]QCT01509.1 putative multiple sugar transport system substrate-binding protein YtcQ [Paenibacillus algicola]
MLKKTKKASVILVSFVLLCVVVLSGCAGNENGNGADSNAVGSNGASATDGKQDDAPEATKSLEPIKVTALQPYWGALPDMDGSLFKYIEQSMNVEFETEFVFGPNFMDKVNVALASGNLPHMLYIFDGKQPSIVTAIRAGAFWELDGKLEKYPNLMAGKDKIRDENIKVDGKTYQIYIPEAISRQGMNMRQDWLDNLGLQKPTTIDELYNVLRAFTQDDPDRNGKNDTIGLAQRLHAGVPVGFPILLAKFGAPNGYEVKDNKFIPAFTTEAYRETMRFFKKLYDEGIMNQDFSYLQRTQGEELIQNGKAGVQISNVDEKLLWNPLLDSNPNASIVSLSYLEGPTGNHLFTSKGYWVTIAFPKSTVKTEEELDRLLAALDLMAAPEQKEFFMLGIEGEHYKKDNGNISIVKNVESELVSLRMFAPDAFEPIAPPGTPKHIEDMCDVLSENETSNNLVNNPAASIISKTAIELGGELDKMIQDATVKYIMGEVNDQQFDEVIEKWKSSGGVKMLEEFEAEYNKK